MIPHPVRLAFVGAICGGLSVLVGTESLQAAISAFLGVSGFIIAIWAIAVTMP